jgi:hypothetical protein
MTQRNQEKTTLHNFFVKQGTPQPTYNTERVGGPDHCQEFRSSLTLSNGTFYRGPISLSRKEAEARVSAMALEDLVERRKSLLLIDAETMAGLAFRLTGDMLKLLDVHVLHQVESQQDFSSLTGIAVILTEGRLPYVMSMHLGYFLGRGLHSRYIVASSSMAMANVLSAGIERSTPWSPSSLILLTKEENLPTLLDL